MRSDTSFLMIVNGVIFRRRWSKNIIHSFFHFFFLKHLLNKALAGLRNFRLFEQATQTGTEFERGSNFELRPLAPQQSITHSPQKREQRKNTIAPNKQKNRHRYLKQENSRTYFFFDILVLFVFFGREFFFEIYR